MGTISSSRIYDKSHTQRLIRPIDNNMWFKLFWTYIKIGTFTIGGGYAMLPLIEREVVDKQHWIDEEEFLNMIALAQAAPGLIAVNSAIFIGWRIAQNSTKNGKPNRWRSISYISATIAGAILPSIIIILAIAILFKGYREIPAIEAVFKGVRPAVVALIAATVIRMLKKI